AKVRLALSVLGVEGETVGGVPVERAFMVAYAATDPEFTLDAARQPAPDLRAALEDVVSLLSRPYPDLPAALHTARAALAHPPADTLDVDAFHRKSEAICDDMDAAGLTDWTTRWRDAWRTSFRP